MGSVRSQITFHTPAFEMIPRICGKGRGNVALEMKNWRLAFNLSHEASFLRSSNPEESVRRATASKRKKRGPCLSSLASAKKAKDRLAKPRPDLVVCRRSLGSRTVLVTT